MNRLELFNELAQSIDKDITVLYAHDTECDIYGKIIYVGEYVNIGDYIINYINIDNGYEWFKFCSSVVWGFLHELGHIVNGFLDIDAYSLVITVLKDNDDISYYNKQLAYTMLDDEIYANEWAYEFLLKNKKVIKRLEVELAYANSLKEVQE